MPIPDRLVAALADRYRIERELGQGGMATVYLAEDLKHQRKVAIKVLRQDLGASLGAERFAREIAVAARLQHPHILGLLDSGEAGGSFYYVMPYVDGETLRDRLTRGGELPVHDAVRLLGEISDALAVAHRAGVVHRDIKPENILISGRHAMVMDFGVAKAVTESTGAHQLTSMGVALGTPAYMAPEQATADPQMDARVDIYALGVLAYEMLTGRAPFHGLTPQQTLAAHVTEAPVPVGQRRPGLSPLLETVVMRCLAKRPADRFQTADELVGALEPLTTPSGGTTPHGTAPYTARAADAQAAAPSRRGLFVAGSVVVVALVAWGASRALTPTPVEIEVGRSRQVTREIVPELHVAISPDGREVAYQSGWSYGETHIEVRDIEGGRSLALTADWQGGQWWPRWLPDGRNLVVVNQRPTADHGAGLWKLPRLGGEAVRTGSEDEAALLRGLSFAIAGDSLTVIGADGTRGSYSLTGPLQELVASTARARADGRAVAVMVGNADYIARWTNVAPSAIWVIVPGQAPVRVTDDVSLNATPAWLPDGTLLYVSNKDGSRDIWAVRLERDGSPIEATRRRLTTGLGAYSISISDDGRTLAYDRVVHRQNIYAIAIPTNGAASVADARPVTNGNQVIERFALSRDGQWLAFDSNREGNQQIFVMPAAGGAARRVTRHSGDDFAPHFSGAGRTIVFHSTRDGPRTVYEIEADGTGEKQVTSGPGQAWNPALSPDGLRLAYGDIGSGLFLMERRARGEAWQPPKRIAVPNAFGPRWSPDGTQLVYHVRAAPGGIGVWSLDGTTREVVSGGAGFPVTQFAEWSSDGRAIYFGGIRVGGEVGIYRVEARGGVPQLALRFDAPALQPFGGGPVAVGNGKIYFTAIELESDIFVVDLTWK